MKYWKVYAQGVEVAEPIKEIDENEVEDCARELVEHSEITGSLASERATVKAIEALNDIEILSCGDYCVVAQDQAPTERPTSCGYDTHIFAS